jgi:hypothetical protein
MPPQQSTKQFLKTCSCFYRQFLFFRLINNRTLSIPNHKHPLHDYAGAGNGPCPSGSSIRLQENQGGMPEKSGQKKAWSSSGTGTVLFSTGLPGMATMIFADGASLPEGHGPFPALPY